ncbi:ComEA family DNA-binding protein [Nocardia salmonicida]
MSRHEEHERVRQRLGGLAVRERVRPGSQPPRESGRVDSRVDDDAGQWDEDELAPASGPPGAVATPGWLDDGASRGRNRLVPERFREARLDPGRRGAIVLGLVGVIAVVLTGVMVLRDQPVARAVPPVPALRAESIAVHADPTVAVAAVSGRGPSTSQIGQPRLGSIMIGAGRASPPAPTSAGPSKVGSDSTGPSTGGGTGAKSRIDLNTATEAELDALPGVGPVTAKAILAWRSTNGRFTDVAQLGEVDGIGPARLARLRELVTT